MSPDDHRHGTRLGAEMHRKAGEKPCEPCRVARNAYHQAWKRKQKEHRYIVAKATERALKRLAERHFDEFEALLAEEMS